MNLQKYQKKVARPAHSIWTNPVHFVACGFGFGAFPFFPGTIGTAVAIPLAIMLSHLPIGLYILCCLILFCAGIYLCHVVNRDFGTNDHPAAVFDEISTFPVVMIAIPMTWYFLLIGFFLFRFFDIVKPGPIRWVDAHVHNGFGVMLDDLLAAIASCFILHIIFYFFK